MKESIRKVVAMCAHDALRDEPWQDFGFSKRPRSGSLLQWLRSRWKADLENKIMREMIAVFTAAHVLAERVMPEDVPEVIRAYTELGLVRAFGLTTRNEAVEFFTTTIAQYVNTPVEDWHMLVVDHIAPNSVPDKALQGRLLVGGIQFAQHAGNMVSILKGAENQINETREPSSS